jgi:hypothetical protein
MGVISGSELEAWMASRPDSVKALAAEFPLHMALYMPASGTMGYVIGWREDDHIMVSPFRLDKDYDEAVRLAHYVKAPCYRGEEL